MKKKSSFLYSESGFTLMETMLVMAVLAIIISITMISMNSYSDRNIAISVKHDANNTLDVSKGYLLSTASPEKAELTKRLEKILEGYTINVYDDYYFTIVVNPTTSTWEVKLYYKVDDGLTLYANIIPDEDKVTLKGQSSDTDRLERLVDEGVIEP